MEIVKRAKCIKVVGVEATGKMIQIAHCRAKTQGLAHRVHTRAAVSVYGA